MSKFAEPTIDSAWRSQSTGSSNASVLVEARRREQIVVVLRGRGRSSGVGEARHLMPVDAAWRRRATRDASGSGRHTPAYHKRRGGRSRRRKYRRRRFGAIAATGC